MYLNKKGLLGLGAIVLIILIVSLAAYSQRAPQQQEIQSPSQIDNQIESTNDISTQEQAKIQQEKNDWKVFFKSFDLAKDNPPISQLIMIKYPSEWYISSTPFIVSNFTFSKYHITDSFNRSDACVSLYLGANSPQRIDVGNIISTLSNIKFEFDQKEKIVSSKKIEVNNRVAVKRTVLRSGESTPTFEVFILGDEIHNNNYPSNKGRFASIYTLVSCPNTNEEIFDGVVSTFNSYSKEYLPPPVSYQ